MSSKELKQALPGLLIGHRLTADQTNKQQCPDMPLRAEQMLSHLKRNRDFQAIKSGTYDLNEISGCFKLSEIG